MTYDKAIQEITEKLGAMDRILTIGDLNETEFKQITKVYMAGVILRAQLQASKTLKGARDE